MFKNYSALLFEVLTILHLVKMINIDDIYNKVLTIIPFRVKGCTIGGKEKRKKPNIVSICGSSEGTAPSYSDVPSAPPAASLSFALNTLTQPFLCLISSSAKMLGSI